MVTLEEWALSACRSRRWDLWGLDQAHHSFAHVPLVDVEIRLEVRGVKRPESIAPGIMVVQSEARSTGRSECRAMASSPAVLRWAGCPVDLIARSATR